MYMCFYTFQVLVASVIVVEAVLADKVDLVTEGIMVLHGVTGVVTVASR
jgi:hypothetical protein